MKLGSLFSGIGGIEIALEACGYTTQWQCEVDQYAAQVLDRHWGVPNLGDITQVDWAEVQPVEMLIGGFPCQDISTAGKGAGIAEGTRSGLWFEYAKCIGVLRPRVVFIENVSALAVRGLNIVLSDLAALGFNAEWGTVRASDVGAPHRRERLFIVARDANQQSRHERWITAPGQTQGGWARADACRSSGASAADNQGVRWRTGVLRGRDSAQQPQPRGDSAPTTDTNGASGEARSGRSRTGHLGRHEPLGSGHTDWSVYTAAIRRWEHTAGPAPRATDDRGRLAPEFVEWMMGFPAGWTDGLPRAQRLKCLGNAVVPHADAVAFQWLTQRHAEVAA